VGAAPTGPGNAASLRHDLANIDAAAKESGRNKQLSLGRKYGWTVSGAICTMWSEASSARVFSIQAFRGPHVVAVPVPCKALRSLLDDTCSEHAQNSTFSMIFI
jgi:hypothetical protein